LPGRARQTHGGGDGEQQWGQEPQGKTGQSPVPGTLDDAADTRELGLLDMQQWHASDRADVQAGTGHLDQTGRDHKVGIGALQLPRQPAQTLGVDLGRGRDGDDVGPAGTYGGGDVVGATQQRYSKADEGGTVTGSEASADELHSAGPLLM